MNIYLDLEETIIDDWNSGNFLPHNIRAIKNNIRELENYYGEKVEHINIFSFAIVNKSDIELFNKIFRDDIEKIFDKEIKNVVICDNKLLQRLLKPKGVQVSHDEAVQDVLTINPKAQYFDLYVKDKYPGEISVLFDDMVDNNISKTIIKSSKMKSITGFIDLYDNTEKKITEVINIRVRS